MTTNKFLFIDTTGTEILGQGIATSAGVADANKLVSTGANGKLDATILPSTTGTNAETMPASGSLSAGAFVNIFSDAGTRKCRLADASNSRPAHGYVTTSVADAGSATVNLSGNNDALTGLTIGSRYFLSSSTPGGTTVTVTLTSGHIVQCVGVAVSATSIRFEFDDFISVA